MKLEKVFLLTSAGILFPVALSYGFIPEQTFALLYGLDISVTDENIIHMLRALMGLYLGMLSFWIVGALYEKYRFPALCSLTVFMFAVASGRLFSMLFDGVPFWAFVFFLVSEIVLGSVGVWFIKKT